MKLLATTSAPPGQPEVVCPVDGSTIHWDEAGLTCLACGRHWERDGNVALFLPNDAVTTTGAGPGEMADDDPVEFAPRHDWRFRLPIDETTRVLEMGTRDEFGAVSLAFEAGRVLALREDAADAVRLDRRAREQELGTLTPIATPLGILPIADRSIDVAVIHDALERVARRTSRGARAERSLLRALFRKIALGGLLWAEVPNRFALANAGWSWVRGRGRHGLGGLRTLLAENGFAKAQFFAVVSLDGRRECVPLDDPTPFDFALGRASREHRGDGSGRSERLSAMAAALARRAFRSGLIPWTAERFAILAERGRAR